MDNLLICLVVYLPIWKIWKSIGMSIPNIWKTQNVPNQQSVMFCIRQPQSSNDDRCHICTRSSPKIILPGYINGECPTQRCWTYVVWPKILLGECPTNIWSDDLWINWSFCGFKNVTVPSGKRLHSYRKSPFLMGKLTISRGNFLCSITRGYII